MIIATACKDQESFFSTYAHSLAKCSAAYWDMQNRSYSGQVSKDNFSFVDTTKGEREMDAQGVYPGRTQDSVRMEVPLYRKKS